MSRKAVDLVRVRAALATLDQVQAQHPEVFRGWTRPEQWIGTLEGKEAMTETIQIAVRLPAALVQRLDAYTEDRNSSEPGLYLTRSDAVRLLLSTALQGAAEPSTAQGKGSKAKTPKR